MLQSLQKLFFGQYIWGHMRIKIAIRAATHAPRQVNIQAQWGQTSKPRALTSLRAQHLYRLHNKITLNKRAKQKYRSQDRKSTRLNSSHVAISYAVFCLKKKKKNYRIESHR